MFTQKSGLRRSTWELSRALFVKLVDAQPVKVWVKGLLLDGELKLRQAYYQVLILVRVLQIKDLKLSDNVNVPKVLVLPEFCCYQGARVYYRAPISVVNLELWDSRLVFWGDDQLMNLSCRQIFVVSTDRCAPWLHLKHWWDVECELIFSVLLAIEWLCL